MECLNLFVRKINKGKKARGGVAALPVSGAKAFKYIKSAGNKLSYAGIAYAGYKLIENRRLGNGTRLAISIATTAITAVCPVLGLAIGFANLILGDDLYNWIDKH